MKDDIDVAGIPTTAACPAYAYTPDRDAFVVARLRAAGALVVGKTNLDQFATGLVGVRTPYGAPLNAIDPAIVPVDFAPFHAVARLLYDGTWVAERHMVIADLLASDPDDVHPITRAIVCQAESKTADDVLLGIYRLAELRRAAELALADLDLLCVPTILTFYSVSDLDADPIGPSPDLGTYTNFVNLLDMCGIAVPTAPRADARPGSGTPPAPAGWDALVSNVERGFERDCDRKLGATDHAVPKPEPALLKDISETLEVAVCGARMAGLPLNHQLTDLGATFLRATRTAPDYRFYALAGGPPARPGLARAPGPEAGSVAVEVWAVPRVAIGAFFAGIPAPLGLGRIALEDGSQVTGFLCETAGLDGAREITALGDWRTFLAQPVAA